MDLALMAINPIAFSIGAVDVRWYGIIIACGILLGYFVAQNEMKKRGFGDEFLTDLLIWTVPIAIICARIYYVIFEWSYYSQNPGDIIQIWNGGIAIHGALIGGGITVYVFCKKRGVSFWQVADILAPSILIGQILGRWGNFMNREAHGGPVTQEFLENLMIPDWIINQMNIGGIYYHPTFLYESLWNILGLIVLLLLRKVNLRRGEIFLTYVIWYSFGRFFIEGLRTDSLLIMGFRTAQLVSLIALVIAVIVFIYRRIKMKSVRYKD